MCLYDETMSTRDILRHQITKVLDFHLAKNVSACDEHKHKRRVRGSLKTIRTLTLVEPCPVPTHHLRIVIRDSHTRELPCSITVTKGAQVVPDIAPPIFPRLLSSFHNRHPFYFAISSLGSVIAVVANGCCRCCSSHFRQFTRRRSPFGKDQEHSESSWYNHHIPVDLAGRLCFPTYLIEADRC